MVHSCEGKFMKYTLFFLTLLFWISGGVLLGIGIWLRVDKNILTVIRFVSINPNNPVWDAAAYFIIVIGAVVLLISFCGCCGACTENRCLLIMYAVLVAVLLCCEVAAAIMAGFYSSKIDGETQRGLQRQLKEDYRFNNTVGDTWNYVQFTFKCCGAESYDDYKVNQWQEPLPATCCVLTNSDYANPKPISYSNCTADYNNEVDSSKYLYTVGCYPQIKNWVTAHSDIVIGVCAGVAALQLILVIFASCLAHKLL